VFVKMNLIHDPKNPISKWFCVNDLD